MPYATEIGPAIRKSHGLPDCVMARDRSGPFFDRGRLLLVRRPTKARRLWHRPHGGKDGAQFSERGLLVKVAVPPDGPQLDGDRGQLGENGMRIHSRVGTAINTAFFEGGH